MQLTQQIKIEPSPSQEIVLQALSEKCRLIYNFALKERKEAFGQGIKGVNYIKQQNDLPKLKGQFPEYSWVYSKVLQYTLRTLDADYKSFFALHKKGDKNARLPNFKGKNFFTTMTYNQSGVKSGKGWVEFSHKHPIGTKLRFAIPEQFLFSRIYQASVYRKEKRYFLSIVYDKEEKEFVDNQQYQAFDLGVMKQTAVNLQGRFKEFANQRPDKYWQKPTKELQSRRDHCKKYSRKWKKLSALHNKCKRKSANQMKDFQHKMSRKIINNTKANTIIVGDLSPKEMCKPAKTLRFRGAENLRDFRAKEKYKKGLHRSVHNSGLLGRFVGFLTYKAKLAGKRVVEINERGTSKKCCVCGKEQDMPLKNREYECDCGNKIDRDKNSAINIMARYLSQNGLWTAYQQFAGNLRQTGLAVASYSQEALTSTQGVRSG